MMRLLKWLFVLIVLLVVIAGAGAFWGMARLREPYKGFSGDEEQEAQSKEAENPSERVGHVVPRVVDPGAWNRPSHRVLASRPGP